MDLVSVIVPIYNAEKYLSRCVNSLLAQTYPNIEIILVDDNSTDRSGEIVKLYESKYPDKCRVIQRKQNGRASAARNDGMAAAQGEWVIFVDSDDWVSNDYVETLCSVAAQDGADIVMSSIYYYYSDKNCIEVCPFADLTTESSHKEKVALSRPYITTRLFRRSLFVQNNLSFQEDIWRAAEMPTAISLLTITEKISIIRKPMYYYFQRKTSNSNQNHMGVDVSFYPKTVDRMIHLSRPGFEAEMEFRAVTELLYGMVMIMVRSGRTNEELKSQVDSVIRKYPNWKENIYLSRMSRGKLVFVQCAAQKQFWMLKAMIGLWDFILRMKGRS